MTQDWRTFGTDALSPPLQAALRVFVREGYHGASIRSIAEAAGLSVPGLYHHHRSKQAILDAIVTAAMAEMLAHSHAAQADSDGTPVGRFDNLVEALARFHMERRDHAFLASTEMRSMDPEVRTRHVAQRDQQQRLLEGAVAAGVADGSFVSIYPTDAARAIASLCVSITSWYQPSGPLTQDEVVERHLDFARRIVGASRHEPVRAVLGRAHPRRLHPPSEQAPQPRAAKPQSTDRVGWVSPRPPHREA